MFKFEKYGICQVPSAPLRANPSDTSEIVNQLLFGELLKVIETGRPWVKVKVIADDYEGFMDFKQLIYLNESQFKANTSQMPLIVNDINIDVNGPNGILRILLGSCLPFFENGKFKLGEENFEIISQYNLESENTLIETAHLFLNTPYLWGGRSIHGIDCSGYTQLVAKLQGWKIPRDASEQEKIGEEIDFKARQEGDFVFYINEKGIVHHVGILVTKNEVLHASGWVRRDITDEKGIFRADLDTYSHKHHSVRRVLQ